MGGFGRFMPEDQLNPVLGGLTQAFSFAQIMKQQAMQQEEMQMRQAHQQRLDRADDVRMQMELNNSGASPVDAQGRTQQQVETPAQTLPGSDGKPLLTIPGQTVSGGVPANPARTVSWNGQGYELPTPAQQLQSKMNEQAGVLKTKNDADFSLWKREQDDGRAAADASKIDVGGGLRLPPADARSILTERERTAAQAKAEQQKEAFESGENKKKNDAEMARTVYTQTQENKRKSTEIGATTNREATQNALLIQQRQADRISAQHDKLEKTETENKRTLADIAGLSGVKDGDEYTDPLTGKQQEMNAIRRQQLANRSKALTEENAASEQSRLKMRQKYKLGEFDDAVATQQAAPKQYGPKGTPLEKHYVGETVYQGGKAYVVRGFNKDGTIQAAAQ